MLAPRGRLCTAWWFCDCCAVFMPCLIILFCSVRVGFCSARFNDCERLPFCYILYLLRRFDIVDFWLSATVLFCSVGAGLCSARFSACECLLYFMQLFLFITPVLAFANVYGFAIFSVRSVGADIIRLILKFSSVYYFMLHFCSHRPFVACRDFLFLR